MKAIILAAGNGTRCLPLTRLYPKLVQQVCGIPVLEYMLSWFYGTPEVDKLYLVVNKHSRAVNIKKYIAERNAYQPQIDRLFCQLGYRVENRNPDIEIEVIESKGWGTGGDLRFALDTITRTGKLEENFMVCNGDYIVLRELANGELSPQVDLTDIIVCHRVCQEELGTVMTIALVPVNGKDAKSFGVTGIRRVRDLNVIAEFDEKPCTGILDQRPLVNAGIYLIDRDFLLPKLIEYLPNRRGTALEKTLIGRLVSEQGPGVAAYILDLYKWFDIGTLDRLIEANISIALGKQTARIEEWQQADLLHIY